MFIELKHHIPFFLFVILIKSTMIIDVIFIPEQPIFFDKILQHSSRFSVFNYIHKKSKYMMLFQVFPDPYQVIFDIICSMCKLSFLNQFHNNSASITFFITPSIYMVILNFFNIRI